MSTTPSLLSPISELDPSLASSKNIHWMEVEGKKVILVGTAHVSQKSVEEVTRCIETVLPDVVCVELCPSRYEALTSENRWKDMDLFKVIREQKTFLLLANLLLSAFQRKLGKQLGVQPGAEMMEALSAAQRVGAQYVLADRDVQTTLRRAWRSLSFWEKNKLMVYWVNDLFSSEPLKEEEIERLKESDVLSEAMEAFAQAVPTIKKILIDERDQYLAEKIRQSPGNTIVAVVGAGHVPGIKAALFQSHDLGPLEVIPPPGKLGKWLSWGIPAFLGFLLIYGFWHADAAISMEIVKRWILVNGSLAAIGAALSFAHPLSILAAFVAAPITILHPAIAAGWVSGLVEAFLRKPQVRDFETLADDITSLSGFWKNRITHVLLVVVLTNLGATVGSFITIPALTALFK